MAPRSRTWATGSWWSSARPLQPWGAQWPCSRAWNWTIAGARKRSASRVGLSGGEVSQEDNDYFGDPVVEAARLCATCESGQVLASEWLRLTAGRRSRHECRPLGELALKGLPDPVETVEVLWEPLGGAETAVVPFPAVWPCARRWAWSAGRQRWQRSPTPPSAWPEGKVVRSSSSPARRAGQDDPGGRGGPFRLSTPGPACCSATARRTSPPPTNCSPRPSATT